MLVGRVGLEKYSRIQVNELQWGWDLPRVPSILPDGPMKYSEKAQGCRVMGGEGRFPLQSGSDMVHER